MKYLVMTEGTCELGMLNALLENNMLFFDYDDLLFEDIYHARQLTDRLLLMIDQLGPEAEINIIRVGDKLSDILVIPPDYKNIITKEYKVCTKPELEMMFIVNEGYAKDYSKHKSKMKPSEYYKSKNSKYQKTKIYYSDYFSQLKHDEVYHMYKMYDKNRIRIHSEDEKSLSWLLKQTT